MTKEARDRKKSLQWKKIDLSQSCAEEVGYQRYVGRERCDSRDVPNKWHCEARASNGVRAGLPLQALRYYVGT